MKKKKITAIVSVAILFLAGLFFVGAFAISSIEAISVQRLDSKIIELAEIEKKFKKLNSKYNEWKNIITIYADFKSKYFIPFRNLNIFKQNLEGIINRNSLEVLKNKSQINDIKNEFAKVTISLYLAGPYRLMKRFIYEIEKQREIIYIRSVELKKQENGCLGEFILEAYFVR